MGGESSGRWGEEEYGQLKSNNIVVWYMGVCSLVVIRGGC